MHQYTVLKLHLISMLFEFGIEIFFLNVLQQLIEIEFKELFLVNHNFCYRFHRNTLSFLSPRHDLNFFSKFLFLIHVAAFVKTQLSRFLPDINSIDSSITNSPCHLINQACLMIDFPVGSSTSIALFCLFFGYRVVEALSGHHHSDSPCLSLQLSCLAPLLIYRSI